jgi:sulfonate transport system substrate-binding protein
LAFSSLAFAIQNAKLEDLRVIADVFEDGVDDHFTSKYMVLKDSPIKSVADLKGKVLATVSTGSAMDIAMRAMLRKNGIDDRKEVSIIEAPFATMRALLAEHKADLISATVGFSEDPELQKIGRTLFTQREAVGPTDMIVWTARTGFLAQNRAAMVDFLEDSLRLLRYFETPAHHDEVEALLSQFIKQPPSQFVLDFTDKDFYRNPDGLPDLKALQSNIDDQHQLGLLAQPLTIAGYADLGMVKEAAARLNK